MDKARRHELKLTFEKFQYTIPVSVEVPEITATFLNEFIPGRAVLLQLLRYNSVMANVEQFKIHPDGYLFLKLGEWEYRITWDLKITAIPTQLEAVDLFHLPYAGGVAQ